LKDRRGRAEKRGLSDEGREIRMKGAMRRMRGVGLGARDLE
jgi:hypothetical protein